MNLKALSVLLFHFIRFYIPRRCQLVSLFNSFVSFFYYRTSDDKWNSVGYISAAVSQGPGCLSLRCPDPACSAMVLQGLVNKLAKHEDKEKYARFALRAYVEGSKKVSYSHNYLGDCMCSYCRRYWQFWNHVFFMLRVYVTLIFSCRLNGAQLLTVHVRWNSLVMWTMMSHVIAITVFAGMWVATASILY
jgi:hypothetical protein